ncbi:MAG TPA: hypothetical protein VFW68_15590 [Rhodocyclaceae bacterium]|nr:hypothetical protein [Rhodocyclaceae bacterium]
MCHEIEKSQSIDPQLLFHSDLNSFGRNTGFSVRTPSGMPNKIGFGHDLLEAAKARSDAALRQSFGTTTNIGIPNGSSDVSSGIPNEMCTAQNFSV